MDQTRKCPGQGVAVGEWMIDWLLLSDIDIDKVTLFFDPIISQCSRAPFSRCLNRSTLS